MTKKNQKREGGRSTHQEYLSIPQHLIKAARLLLTHHLHIICVKQYWCIHFGETNISVYRRTTWANICICSHVAFISVELRPVYIIYHKSYIYNRIATWSSTSSFEGCIHELERKECDETWKQLFFGAFFPCGSCDRASLKIYNKKSSHSAEQNLRPEEPPSGTIALAAVPSWVTSFHWQPSLEALTLLFFAILVAFATAFSLLLHRKGMENKVPNGASTESRPTLHANWTYFAPMASLGEAAI